MSLKDDVNYVKDELNSEEKFLEGFVKVERFYKKYKALILGLSIIAVVAIVAILVKGNIDESNKLAANQAFTKVINDPKDTQALETLKEKNKNLYDIAIYLNAKKENKSVEINAAYLKELNEYSKAIQEKSVEKLNNLSMQSDFLLKEFAIFNKALLLAKEGKTNEAKAALQLIPADSRANELASLLKHYLVTK